MLKHTAYTLEQLIPYADVFAQIEAKQNDKEGVHFYHVVKQVFTQYDIAADNLLKDNYQGLMDKWIT